MHRTTIAMTALMLAPLTLRAEELEFGVRTRASWTDNVYAVPEDQADPLQQKVDGYSVRIYPHTQVRDPDGEFTWSLRYQPSYEYYLDESERSGFDHAFSGQLSWRFAERWTFTLDERYADHESVTRFNETAEPGEEATVGFRDAGVRISRTNAMLSHQLTPRDSLSLSASYRFVEYLDSDAEDRRAPSAAFSWNHLLNERTSAGLRFSWAQQMNRSNRQRDDETFFYNLSGTLSYRFSPSLSLVASAGPTYVDSEPLNDPVFQAVQFPLDRFETEDFGIISVVRDADLCVVDGVPGRARNFAIDCERPSMVTGLQPAEVNALRGNHVVPGVDGQGVPADAGSDGSTLTYFANLLLVKDWEYWRGTLGYVRSNSESARFGSSTVADTVFGSLTWEPGELWTLGISGAYSLQEQALDQAVPIALQLENVPAPEGVTTVTELASVTGVILSDRDTAPEYRTASVRLQATRRLSRRASAYATLYWYEQEQEVGAPVNQTTHWDNLTISVGLRWLFDPIRF